MQTDEIGFIAEKLMDFYEGGQYAYEEGQVKTDKQKNIKRDLKQSLEEHIGNNSNKRFYKAWSDWAKEYQEPERLRKDNIELRAKVKSLEEANSKEKEVIRATHIDTIREEERENVREEYREYKVHRDNNSLKYQAALDRQELIIKQYTEDRVSRSEYNSVKERWIASEGRFAEISKEIKRYKKCKKCKKKKKKKEVSSSESESESESD